MSLTASQEELCTQSRWDFTDLRALYVNCTLKPSPELSHTEGLMRTSMAIMKRNGVEVDYVRAVDHDLAPGTWPDMREHGAASDEWPALYERVQAADVLVHRCCSGSSLSSTDHLTPAHDRRLPADGPLPWWKHQAG